MVQNQIRTLGGCPYRIMHFDLQDGRSHVVGRWPEIFIVIEGHAEHESTLPRQAIRPGTALVCHAGNRIKFHNPESLKVVSLRFVSEWLSNDLLSIMDEPDLFSLFFAVPFFKFPAQNSVFVFPISDLHQGSITSDLRILTGEIEKASPYSMLARCTLVKLLLTLSGDFSSFWDQKNRINLPTPIPNVVQMIESTIDKGMPIYLDDLEPFLGMTMPSFQAMFEQKIGCKVEDYALMRLASRTSHLLLSSDQPLSTLAQQLGFEEDAAMVDNFRVWFETTPEEYRSARKRAADALVPA